MMNWRKQWLVGALIGAACMGVAEADMKIQKPAKPKAELTAEQALEKVGRPSGMRVAQPIMPFADPRLILFEYDPNLAYEIHTKDELYTHIQVEEGDRILGFYLSDSKHWSYHITKDKRRLFIKPRVGTYFTAATMVTERRTYELTFVSVKTGEQWYQRVTWDYPGAGGEGGEGAAERALANGIYEEASLGDEEPTAVPAPPRVPSVMPSMVSQDEAPRQGGSTGIFVDPSRLRFDYTIEGRASFAPVSVFDDGKFTYFRYDKSLQDMPAIFAIGEDGNAEIVNYTVKENYVLVSKIVPGLLLKLGDLEVKIMRRAKR